MVPLQQPLLVSNLTFPAVSQPWKQPAFWRRLIWHSVFSSYLRLHGPEHQPPGKYPRSPGKEPFRRCCGAFMTICVKDSYYRLTRLGL